MSNQEKPIEFGLTFGEPPNVSERTQRDRRLRLERLSSMHRKYGKGPAGQTCDGCVHLVRVAPGRGTFFKCALYRISRSEATDWRKKWAACGSFR